MNSLEAPSEEQITRQVWSCCSVTHQTHGSHPRGTLRVTDPSGLRNGSEQLDSGVFILLHSYPLALSDLKGLMWWDTVPGVCGWGWPKADPPGHPVPPSSCRVPWKLPGGARLLERVVGSRKGVSSSGWALGPVAPLLVGCVLQTKSPSDPGLLPETHATSSLPSPTHGLWWGLASVSRPFPWLGMEQAGLGYGSDSCFPCSLEPGLQTNLHLA